MNRAFGGYFCGKKVMVTGHTGFKGSWLSIWLRELGAEVTGYALPPKTERDNFGVAGLENLMTSIIGDIRDYGRLVSALREHEPEIVFHLAAQPIVKNSYDDPLYTFEVNAMGTANVLEATRSVTSVKTLVIITSDKCYENKEWDWGYRENDQLGGHDVYSASKAAAELVTNAFQRSFFQYTETCVASVRAGNVIGGGDWSAFRLVPDCVRSLREGRPIEVRNPNSTRPWQHVLEPLSGYLTLAANLPRSRTTLVGGWNFGPRPDSIISVKKLVALMIKYWGHGEMLDCGKRQDSKHHEAGLLSLDTSKAARLLQWQACWNVEETVQRAVEWYKNQSVDYDFNVSQIRQYTCDARDRGIEWAQPQMFNSLGQKHD
jgi:CDP-glucose 4,6-dehydratase